MLLDELSYKDSVEKILEMRSNVIRDVIHTYNKSGAADRANHRVTHQLKEITLIIKRTLQQIYDIFYSKEGGHDLTLIESYVTAFKKTFLIPSKLSHGNETPSQSAITRLFSPSSNVHLIVRYLPESIQSYTPEFEPAPTLSTNDVQHLVQTWLFEQVETLLKEKIPETLSPIQTQQELIQIRSKLWDLLDDDENTKDKTNAWQKTIQSLLERRFSLWDGLFRDSFNSRFKLIMDKELSQLSNQPESIVWETLVDPIKKPQQPKKDFSVTMNIWPGATVKQRSAFQLPNFSSSKEIQSFKNSLRETANDRTDLLVKLQESFDSSLAEIRKDVQAHLVHFDHQNFHVKR
jgi:FtsZ-binding cell division protein ZapB